MRKNLASIFAISLIWSTPVYSLDIPSDVPETLVSDQTDSQADQVRMLWSITQLEMVEAFKAMRIELGDELKKMMLPTEKTEDGWNASGVDMAAVLAGLPGGRQSHALLSEGDGAGLTFFGPPPKHITDGWYIVEKGSKALTFAESEVSGFFAISDRHLLFIGEKGIEKIGAANCSTNELVNATQYITVFRDSSVPFSLENEEDVEAEALAITMVNFFTELQAPRICVLYDKIAPGKYRSRIFNRKGERLGNMEEEYEHVTSNLNLREQLTAKFDMSAFSETEETGEDGDVEQPED